ncbi:MAG: hypothetical protein OXE55_00230 [Flavobacteriaceae bacterium]|nr:hypothetical protein [Flavobacteriaceae bacterium]
MSNKKCLYLIGVGGTGSRVLKAFTLLLASGCKLKNFQTVIPIIIDPDYNNGDYVKTRRLLNLYQKIRSKIDDPNDFFRQEIESLQSLEHSDFDRFNESDFSFPLEEVDTQTFEQYIDFNSLSDDFEESSDDKSFVKLFFSRQNLKSSLKVGFKGNPNMGTVVLNQISDSKEFRKIGESFNDGDSVFIINSIFGGTGAAGLPVLLKNIRNNDEVPNHSKLKESKVGAITYLPYFSIAKKVSEKEINSETFQEKAKVALSYYNRTIIGDDPELDSIYFIGNNAKKSFYDYSVGGRDQENKANFLEMVGAMGIIDFCENASKKKREKNKQVEIKEFGLRGDYAQSIQFSHLSSKDQNEIQLPLSKFKIFSDYLVSQDGLGKSLDVCRWTKDNIKAIPYRNRKYKDSNLTKKYFESKEYMDIKYFLESFRGWLDEMYKNEPSFYPFVGELNRKNALSILGKTNSGYTSIDRTNNSLIAKKKNRTHKNDKIHTTLFRVFEESFNKHIPKELRR